MCGRCRLVFNAFQSLSRVEEPGETHAAGSQDSVAAREPDRETVAPITARHVITEPVADHLFLREEPSPLPAAFSASEPSPRALRPTTAPSAVLAETSAGNIRFDGKIAKEDTALQPQTPEDARTEPGIVLSGEVNSLLVEVPSSQGSSTVATSRLWHVGVFVLFVGLLGQAAYAFRTTLVSNYPQLRPAPE